MDHGAVYSFPAWDSPRHRERFNHLLTSLPYFCLCMPRDQFRSIAAVQLAGLVLGFLSVMMPKYFSDHCFSGLEVVLTRYGYFFLLMATTICSQLSYKKFYENDHPTESSRSFYAGPILIIFNTLTIFVSSVNCFRMTYICSPSSE